jgi:exopolysaccharide production protein ExoQ
MMQSNHTAVPVSGARGPQQGRNGFALVYLVGTMGLFASLGGIARVGWLGGVLFVPVYAVLIALILYGVFTGAKMPLGRLLAVFALVTGLLTIALLSYKPVGALVNVVLLSLDLLFAVWLASWATHDDFRQLVVRAMFIMALLAIPVALFDGAALFYDDPLERNNVFGFANFKGLFPHKIHAGIYNALGAVCAWSMYRDTGRHRHAGLAGLFLLLAAASGSSIALLSLVLGVGGAWFLFLIQQRFGGAILTYVVVWALFWVLLFRLFDLYPALMSGLGRDASMTGRLPIWEFGLRYFADHPFLGSGLGVFFDTDPKSPAQALWLSTLWYAAPSMHSGYLQLLTEAGLVGGSGFIVLLLVAVARSVESRRLWLVGSLAICVVANAAAALFVTHRSLLFVTIAYVAFRALEPQSER